MTKSQKNTQNLKVQFPKLPLSNQTKHILIQIISTKNP